MDWGSFWHNSRVIFKHLNYCFCSQLNKGALESLLLSTLIFFRQQMAGRALSLTERCLAWPVLMAFTVISVKMLQRRLFWTFTHHIILVYLFLFFFSPIESANTIFWNRPFLSTSQIVVGCKHFHALSNKNGFVSSLSLNIHPGFIAGLSFAWFIAWFL